jgi:hypothetical protein
MRSPPEHGDGDRLISGRAARASVAVAPRAGAHVRGAPGRRRGGWQAWRRRASGGHTRRGSDTRAEPRERLRGLRPRRGKRAEDSG